MQRVLMVPWSIEATNSATCTPPGAHCMQSSMMVHVATEIFDIESMPRGGPDASWLDRRLQTDRLEYLDRDDVDHLKRRVVRSMERGGRIHREFAPITLAEVADVPDPKILELGAGHGGLSRALLKEHPTAHVTVTDIEPTVVAAI